MQQRQDPQARLAVIAASVLNDHGGIPFQLRGQFKGQAALGYVPFVLGGSKVKRSIYRYSNNRTPSRLNATAFNVSRVNRK